MGPALKSQQVISGSLGDWGRRRMLVRHDFRPLAHPGWSNDPGRWGKITEKVPAARLSVVPSATGDADHLKNGCFVNAGVASCLNDLGSSNTFDATSIATNKGFSKGIPSRSTTRRGLHPRRSRPPDHLRTACRACTLPITTGSIFRRPRTSACSTTAVRHRWQTVTA